jgi:hypothetical protein
VRRKYGVSFSKHSANFSKQENFGESNGTGFPPRMERPDADKKKVAGQSHAT